MQGQNAPLSVLSPGRAAPSLPSDEGFKDVSCEAEDWCFGRPLDGKIRQGLSTSCAFLPCERDPPMLPSGPSWNQACRTALLTSLECIRAQAQPL